MLNHGSDEDDSDSQQAIIEDFRRTALTRNALNSTQVMIILSTFNVITPTLLEENPAGALQAGSDGIGFFGMGRQMRVNGARLLRGFSNPASVTSIQSQVLILMIHKVDAQISFEKTWKQPVEILTGSESNMINGIDLVELLADKAG